MGKRRAFQHGHSHSRFCDLGLLLIENNFPNILVCTTSDTRSASFSAVYPPCYGRRERSSGLEHSRDLQYGCKQGAKPGTTWALPPTSAGSPPHKGYSAGSRCGICTWNKVWAAYSLSEVLNLHKTIFSGTVKENIPHKITRHERCF